MPAERLTSCSLEGEKSSLLLLIAVIAFFVQVVSPRDVSSPVRVMIWVAIVLSTSLSEPEPSSLIILFIIAICVLTTAALLRDALLRFENGSLNLII